MSNYENLMNDYGRENLSGFFVKYKKCLSVVLICLKVLKRAFLCVYVCRTHLSLLEQQYIRVSLE